MGETMEPLLALGEKEEINLWNHERAPVKIPKKETNSMSQVSSYCWQRFSFSILLFLCQLGTWGVCLGRRLKTRLFSFFLLCRTLKEIETNGREETFSGDRTPC